MERDALDKTETDINIVIDNSLFEKSMNETYLEGQVIVHCHFLPPFHDSLIRIWRSTYLRDRNSAHKSKLLTAYNITFYPVWKSVEQGKPARFTLVFAPLPKSCTDFDLFEDIPQGSGFYTGLITRNKSDVYNVEIKSNISDKPFRWI